MASGGHSVFHCQNATKMGPDRDKDSLLSRLGYYKSVVGKEPTCNDHRHTSANGNKNSNENKKNVDDIEEQIQQEFRYTSLPESSRAHYSGYHCDRGGAWGQACRVRHGCTKTFQPLTARCGFVPMARNLNERIDKESLRGSQKVVYVPQPQIARGCVTSTGRIEHLALSEKTLWGEEAFKNGSKWSKNYGFMMTLHRD